MNSLYYDIVDYMKEAVNDEEFRIVVFIDDLDRCLPEKVVELLEAIKLFLDIKGYLFVMGVDKEVVKKGISYRYRFFEHQNEKKENELIISPDSYLDKMIQLPLELPPIEQGRKESYIRSLLGKSDEYAEHAKTIEIGVGDNPRTYSGIIGM